MQGQLAQRLRELGLSLAAFQKDLGDRMQDVKACPYKFGRTKTRTATAGLTMATPACRS